jgi:hypothetical protein
MSVDIPIPERSVETDSSGVVRVVSTLEFVRNRIVEYISDDVESRVYARMPELWCVRDGGVRPGFHAERGRGPTGVPAV